MQHNRTRGAQSTLKGHHPLWLLFGFWFCVVISIAVVVRRLNALIHPSPSPLPQMAGMDATFASHAVLTEMHIIPAAIFVILAVVVLLRRTGSEWLERSFFLFGTITGLTAYAMSRYAIGGWIERSAVLVFDTWFLFSLGRAYWLRRRGEPALQRTWMTRAVGILLGIATTRPVMGVFFATSPATHLRPNQFFGIAFWIGFSINAAIVELWLHSRRRAQLHTDATPAY
ncbi:MAG TPA: DUF2306 domain-containing protein [Bryobacteraceae bacterium]|jgi:hypothetical protein|nr:DUF2306 domain-containing protein [Bryobacteraceae bacterium]